MSESIDTLFRQAFSEHESGRHSEAREIYERILADNPNHAETLHMLGVLFHQLGDNDSGAKLIKKAVRIEPQNAAYLYNLGVIYQETDRSEEAASCFQSALAVDQTAVSAWVNLGNILLRTGKFTEAANCHRNALSLQPENSEHHVRMGNSMKMQGFVETALSHYGFAYTIDQNHAVAQSALLFASQYEPGINLRELARRHDDWWQKHGKPLSLESTEQFTSTKPGALRIGFVSPDLGNHPVGIFLAPLLEKLKEEADVETTCYTNSKRVDEFATRNQNAADQWRSIVGISDEVVAQTIREDEIDILFDLSGHTDDNRLLLFSRKPAPVQVTWAGYVGTTGLETMDYILADPFHIPESFDEHYVEKPIRLPRDYIPYEPPAYAPEVGPLPMLEKGYPTFGCLNNPTKFSFPSIQIWSEVLREVPDARLILKYKGVDDPAVKIRILGLFASQGITPDRLELLGQTQHRDHLEVFNRIDVALDPIPYSSGLSACEAIWMGVPVITSPGDTFASRHALSHLSNAGIFGTIAEDWSEYVEIATKLVSAPEELQEVRATMRSQVAASPLCDIDGYTKDFLKAMRGIKIS